jgi:hypothetical protein
VSFDWRNDRIEVEERVLRLRTRVERESGKRVLDENLVLDFLDEGELKTWGGLR